MAPSSLVSSVADWWFLTFPLLASGSSGLYLAGLTLIILLGVSILCAWLVPGGNAWGRAFTTRRQTIPGPLGWPLFGILFQMGRQAHRKLAELARAHGGKELMAFSLGNTRMIVTSKPEVARELLNSSAFADRPLKQSAQELLFGRAIGFAPYGDYWRGLRRIASNYLFSPKQIAGTEALRQAETSSLIESINRSSQENGGIIQVREFLQRASLNNIMETVFGKRFEDGSRDAQELSEMVREGFELLGAFNWADHLPLLRAFDPQSILQRCSRLVPRVTSFVAKIIDEHRREGRASRDFVDVLLALSGDERLDDRDMISVLWEMIFRGTDTVALLMEWILAELVLHPEIQSRLHRELDSAIQAREVTESDIHRLPFLHAVVKESLRMHPPGPLLSWARLASEDVKLAGHHIPAGTTAMVNMWSITHDPDVWDEPEKFNPGRFMAQDFDVKGTDLRLAPFGAGRRVCPGRALGLATVHLWTARLVREFEWKGDEKHPVDLSEVLKLSSEMVKPLQARPVPRL